MGSITYLAHAVTRRVGGDGADVVDTETGHVVGLPDETVLDVLVVVDGGDGSLVETSLLGVLEVTDVPDVGHRVLVLSRAVGTELINLVIHDEKLLPLSVEDPTLVSVGSTLVAGNGDDARVGLVGDIVDGEGILVVAIADVMAQVLLMRAPVNEALSIVDVAIVAVAAEQGRVGGVLEIEEDETATALGVNAGTATDDGAVLPLLVGENVVAGGLGHALEVTGDIGDNVEGDGGGAVHDVEELVAVSKEMAGGGAEEELTLVMSKI